MLQDQNTTAEATTTEEVVVDASVALQTNTTAEDFAKLLERADNLEDAPIAISLNMSGYEFKTIGEKVRGVFLGFTAITVKDASVEGGLKEIEAIKWLGSDRQVKFNAGKNLVAQFVDQNVAPNTAVQIELVDEVAAKAGTGKVKVYKVDILAI